MDQLIDGIATDRNGHSFSFAYIVIDGHVVYVSCFDHRGSDAENTHLGQTR